MQQKKSKSKHKWNEYKKMEMKKLNDIRINYTNIWILYHFSLNNSKLLSYSACRYCICCFFLYCFAFFYPLWLRLCSSTCHRYIHVDSKEKYHHCFFYYFILEIVLLLSFNIGPDCLGLEESRVDTKCIFVFEIQQWQSYSNYLKGISIYINPSSSPLLMFKKNVMVNICVNV